VQTSVPRPRVRGSLVAGSTVVPLNDRRERSMLWLIIGVILLIVAIAGGAIVHPILFVLGILALVMFFAGSRGRAGL
jgi:hypothetical protein